MAGGQDQRFFRLEPRSGRWRFLSPQGAPFFSLGMNHIDSSALRYAENGAIWRDKYANDEKKWLQTGVTPRLREWGFNTIGWTQEVVVRGPRMVRHSPRFTFEQYQWAGMPYCHLLPFVEFHEWEFETRYPDVFGTEFEDWCDYVARTDCARMAGDPKLIGYFYSDCPTWVHTRKPDMKGPLFDPEMLKTDAGKKKLSDLATRYYQLTHRSIRRYDRNHLIFGDRYEANAPLPEEVLRAAFPTVDALGFQYFTTPEIVARDFTKWYEMSGKPLLLADAAVPGRNRNEAPARLGGQYEEMLQALRRLPGCVGWHYCGAFLKNRARRQGFMDENEQVQGEFIAAVAKANQETERWVRTLM